MGKQTTISWTDHTFNPWWGCIKVSPGCEHCYAEIFSKRLGWNVWGPARRRFFGDKHWNEPVLWNKQAEQEGRRRRVFCSSMADVFEDYPGLEDQRRRLWELINWTPWLDWLILTKRPENILNMIPAWHWRPANVRMGITVENEAAADKRIYTFLRVWSGKNFISYEPALGIVNFHNIHPEGHERRLIDALAGVTVYPGGAFQDLPAIQWIICGGESGPGCRPMDLKWARYTRDQCRDQGTAFFFKQIGGHPDKLDDPAGWPEDLRIQEFPEEES